MTNVEFKKTEWTVFLGLLLNVFGSCLTAGAFVVKELNAVHKGSTHSTHKRVIIANGRCIFIGDDDEAFKAGDYKLLVDEENKYRAKKSGAHYEGNVVRRIFALFAIVGVWFQRRPTKFST